MSNISSQGPYNFEAVCFSTNYSNFSSISIMKQYFMSTECLDIEYKDENKINFKHTLVVGNNNAHVECNNSYLELTSSSKNEKVSEDTDCFIIFFDLENDESLVELSKICKVISDLSESDKKLYVINIYTNEKNVKCSISEDNAPQFLGRYMLNNYDIYTVNMDAPDELPKIIDSITKDALYEKNMINSNIKDPSSDKSKSGCIIN